MKQALFKLLRQHWKMLSAAIFLLCIVRGGLEALVWQGSFWRGFLSPLLTFTALFVFLLPIVLLYPKHPKAAQRYGTVLLCLCISALGLILVGIVALVLVSSLASLLRESGIIILHILKIGF